MKTGNGTGDCIQSVLGNDGKFEESRRCIREKTAGNPSSSVKRVLGIFLEKLDSLERIHPNNVQDCTKDHTLSKARDVG